jgi:hypothetical protein
MKSLIILTLLFCTHCFVPSLVSATISSKNQSCSTAVPTKKRAYKKRVAFNFLHLKSKLIFNSDKKLVWAWVSFVGAVIFVLIGLNLLNNHSHYYHSGGGFMTGHYGPTLSEIVAFIFSVLCLIISVVLFIVALITALKSTAF